MFALVRFVHEEDKRLHVVEAKDIRDFKPAHEEDFNNRLIYSVMWEDDLNEDNTGVYDAQILMLDSKCRVSLLVSTLFILFPG